MKNQLINSTLWVILLLMLTGCAEKVANQSCGTGDIYGFLGGIWHGLIAPFSLIAMLFEDKVIVFASCNNGFWYSFGFLLGSGGWGLLAGKSKKK